MLSYWFGIMLVKVLGNENITDELRFQQMQAVYNIGFEEIARQVSV
jgi:hypothetical protein